jgi:subtilisin family serine protease
MKNVTRTNSTCAGSIYVGSFRRAVVALLAVGAAIFLSGVLAPSKSFAQPATEPPATASIIVKLAVGLSVDEQGAVIAQNGGARTSTVAALRLHVVEVSADQLDQTIANYRGDPRVVRAELNKVRQSNALPSDPFYSQQWALPRIGWDLVFGNSMPGGSITVAVLDTGIEASHADLFGNVIAGTSILDGSNGLTDPSGHGTMVAGTLAARTNTAPAEGIAGVAYAGVRLMPVTVLDADGLGQDSDIIAGVMWAVDHGANVIVMAFSNPGFSDSLQEAIDYAWSNNVVLVAAAGNDALGTPTYPAGDRGVIGVSATDENDQLASFSNFGPSVFLAAPGTSILTTDIGGTYLSVSGTSSSAAIVAGAAAQLMAIDPTRSNGVIVGRLARNADPAGTQDQTGNGRINLARALADTGTDFVQPNGAGPVGPGGPFVGPYRAAARNWNLTFAGSGAGSVTITPNTGSVSAPTSCGGTGAAAASQTVTNTCSANITTSDNGATITLSAAANSASTFSGWSLVSNASSSACSGTTNPCSLVFGGNGAITVTFNTKPSTTLAVTAATGTYGGVVNLSATLTSSSSGVKDKSIAFTLNGNAVGNATTNASGVAMLSNASLGAISAATYAIGVGASFAGDASFGASSGTAQLTVSPASSTTTVSCPASVTYNGAAQTPCTASYSTSDGLSGSLTPTYTNNVNAGTATASAIYAGDVNHAGSNGSKNFTIAQAGSATTVSCPASVTYNGSAQTPCTASVSGAGGLSLTAAPTHLNNTNAGTATASYTYAGDANHTGSSDFKNFTINKATATVLLANLAQTYDGTPRSATATTTPGGLSVGLAYMQGGIRPRRPTSEAIASRRRSTMRITREAQREPWWWARRAWSSRPMTTPRPTAIRRPTGRDRRRSQPAVCSPAIRSPA